MVDKIKFRIKIRIGNRGTGWISVPFLFKMEEMMKKIIDCLKEKMTEGFGAAGYDEKYAMVSVSNRPDLCQYSVTVRWQQPKNTKGTDSDCQ